MYAVDDLEDIISNIKNLGSGMIDGTGNIYTCACFDHMDLLKGIDIPELNDYRRKMACYEFQEMEDENDFVEQFDDDDHIPWHEYHSVFEDTKLKLVADTLDMLYDKGWLRFVYVKPIAKSTTAFFVEGKANGLKKHKRLTDDLIVLLDVDEYGKFDVDVKVPYDNISLSMRKVLI